MQLCWNFYKADLPFQIIKVLFLFSYEDETYDAADREAACAGSISMRSVVLHGMRTHITLPMTVKLSVQVSFSERAYLSFSTVPVRGMRTPWSLHSFFFRKKKERSKEEKPPPRSLRPKICPPSADGMKLARCARSDSHSVRALRAVKSSPSGRPPFKRAGDLNQRGRLSLMVLRAQFRRESRFTGDEVPYPSRPFSSWRWKSCVAPSALPYAGGPSHMVRSRAHDFLMIHSRDIFVSRRKRRLPCTYVSSNNTADPHMMKIVFIVCGSAVFARCRKHPDVGLLLQGEIRLHKGCAFKECTTQKSIGAASPPV